MAKFNSFEEISSWQKARELNIEIYKLTAANFLSKDFALRDQIRRSSISVTSNLAEGFERETSKEFIRFLYIAKGSAGELRSKLYLSLDIGYISSTKFEELKKECLEVSRMISGLIKYLLSTL